MLHFLPEVEDRGYRFYFLFTVNAYPKAFEPNLPPLAERISTFIELSERIGPRRVIWRYDPIILSNRTDASYHHETFDACASSSQGIPKG